MRRPQPDSSGSRALITSLLLLALSASLMGIAPAAVAGASAPAVLPPPEIVGTWYAGSTSSVGFVDPGTGSYTDGGSDGLSYTFLPDGSWQSGYLVTSALYSCQMQVMVFHAGVLGSVNPVTHMLQLDTTQAQMHSEDTCSVDEDYDKDLPLADEILVWRRATDEYGDVLMLRNPDTGYSSFRPMGS